MRHSPVVLKSLSTFRLLSNHLFLNLQLCISRQSRCDIVNYLVSALVTNFDILPATRISYNYISDVEGYRLRLKQSILIPDALILLYTSLSSLPVFSSYFRITTPVKSMEALSTEWRSGVQYTLGDRVAFKITGSLGLAAFECLQTHISSSDKQPIAGGNAFWKHYPRGFPRSCVSGTNILKQVVHP